MNAVDKLEVLVLVDNVTDSLSTNPAGVAAEWSGLLTGGKMRVLSGETMCCAHHGFSVLVTAHVAGEARSVLFDAGPYAPTLLRNADILRVELAPIDAVVLSHGHWDHGGGLVGTIEAIVAARGGKPVDCYLHPEMFAERAMQRPSGEVLQFQSVPDPDSLSKSGAKVLITREPQLLCGGAFYLSGEIARVTPYERGFPGHVRRGAGGSAWEPDPLIIDERFLSVNVRGKGQFVFSACSHAGVVNVLKQAQALFPEAPLFGVMGGLHLSGATEKIIPQTVEDLQRFALKLVAPGHCTGWRAISAMSRAFGEELVPSAVGKRYTL